MFGGGVTIATRSEGISWEYRWVGFENNRNASKRDRKPHTYTHIHARARERVEMEEKWEGRVVVIGWEIRSKVVWQRGWGREEGGGTIRGTIGNGISTGATLGSNGSARWWVWRIGGGQDFLTCWGKDWLREKKREKKKESMPLVRLIITSSIIPFLIPHTIIVGYFVHVNWTRGKTVMTSPAGKPATIVKKARRKISLPWFRQSSVTPPHAALSRQHTIDTPSSFQARLLHRQPSLSQVLEHSLTHIIARAQFYYISSAFSPHISRYNNRTRLKMWCTQYESIIERLNNWRK